MFYVLSFLMRQLLPLKMYFYPRRQSEPAPLPSGKSLTGTERFLIFIIALVIAGAIVVLITK